MSIRFMSSICSCFVVGLVMEGFQAILDLLSQLIPKKSTNMLSYFSSMMSQQRSCICNRYFSYGMIDNHGNYLRNSARFTRIFFLSGIRFLL